MHILSYDFSVSFILALKDLLKSFEAIFNEDKF